MATNPGSPLLDDERRAPSVPGGGPVSRWSPSRVTSPGAWVWLGLVLIVPLVGAAAVLGGVSDAGITGTAVGIALGALMIWVILLAGIGAAVGAANDSRVDDDVRVYSGGVRVRVRAGGSGPAGAAVLATVQADGRDVATLFETVDAPARRTGRKNRGGPSVRRVIAVDGAAYALRAGVADEVVLVEGGAAGTPVARVRTHRRGPWRDDEIEVDGHLFRLRSYAGRTPPRRTLLGSDGRAWRVEHRRDATVATLPEEMTGAAAAFVSIVVSHLHAGRLLAPA